MTTTVAIRSSYDSFTRQSQSTTNYYDDVRLRLRTDTGEHRYSYLFFPVTIPLGATIVSATLSVKTEDAWSGGSTITAKRITASWKERAITYDNAPAVTTTNAASATPSAAANEFIDITVTALVQDWTDGAANYGFRLETSSTTMRTVFSSEAVTARQPVLTISYILPAEVPVNLRPDGGVAVSEEEPLLVWESSTPAETQCQIDTVETFDSGPGSEPEWDSGWVANTQTSYDTFEDGSPPLLIEGVTYYWRVRTRDASEVTSDWSGAAEFVYEPYGTLTITTPAADNDDVNTTTPVIAHTFTDQTQAAVEYELYADGVKVSPASAPWSKAASTLTSFELPDGLVVDEAVDYTVLVRVWDDTARSAVGALPYVEAERIFQLNYDGTPNPVTAFTATGSDGHVALAWSRAAEPDYFAIEVDGAIVEDRLNASDLFVSGTEYAYNYYGATPNVAHTYKVHSIEVTAGVALYSDDSPSDADTYVPIGIWLVDATDGYEVHILGESVSSTLGESGATFFPLSSQAPVRVTDLVRGLEGTVAGTVSTTTLGQSVATSKAALEHIKSNPGHDFRLVYGYRNIPVVIGEVEFSLLPYGTEVYDIGFEFWQVAEFDVED